MKLRAYARIFVVLSVAILGCTPGTGSGTTGSATASAGAAMARIRAAGTLRWGADTQGGEPHVYPDPADPSRVIGFEVDLAGAIARELGVRAEFVQNDWVNLVPSLERG